MLAELMARCGSALLDGVPPDGKDYWAARFWDRESAEHHPILGPEFLRQKDSIAEYIRKYGRDAGSVLEFACGTGAFTQLAAEHTPATKITALDISADALERARAHVRHPNLRLVQGDFWQDNDLGTGDVVMCLDAIHHLGDVEQVLNRMKTFIAPGGVFIGNLWIGDHFHEFERKRYGVAGHLYRTAAFLGTALSIRLSRGGWKTGAYRTQVITSEKGNEILERVFSTVHEVEVHDYFMGFVCTP